MYTIFVNTKQYYLSYLVPQRKKKRKSIIEGDRFEYG